MADINQPISIIEFNSASDDVKNMILNKPAGGTSFDVEVPFTITGHDVVNGNKNEYDAQTGALVQSSIITRRPMIVLTTSQSVNIFLNQLRKRYKDVNGTIHQCGGNVFDEWRKVSRIGKTNEQFINDLIEVTKDSKGKQRNLIASYTTITWIDPYNKDKGEVEKAILSINFAD